MTKRPATHPPRALRPLHATLRAAALALAAAICPLPCLAATPATASTPQGAIEQGLLCRGAVRAAEAASALPPHMLAGIARVESGRSDPVTGRVHPWPWTINTEGRDHIFDTKAEAVAFARDLQARGVKSFDAGCLQVNLMYHPDAFQSLEEAFDPMANARYAVKFLTELRDKTGSWETASAWYHSANPAEGTPYRGKVISAMAEEAKTDGAYGSLPTTALASAAPAGFALPSMPSRFGGALAMGAPPRATTMGMGTSRVYAGLAGASLAAAAPAQVAAYGTSSVVGRGLDAYRLRPVALAGRGG